jgi:prepilin-type N-terminal cleavage/methylation domain-containing protein
MSKHVGFTIVELLIVLAVIASLSYVALVTVNRIQKAKTQFMADCHYPKATCEGMWRNQIK